MNTPITSIIKNLELELLQPEVRLSVVRLSELIADDFVEFGASGKKYTKQDILSLLPGSAGTRYVIQDFAVIQIAPDTIMATYRVESETLGSGDRSSSLRSSLWRNRDERWQIFFHQGTPL